MQATGPGAALHMRCCPPARRPPPLLPARARPFHVPPAPLTRRVHAHGVRALYAQRGSGTCGLRLGWRALRRPARRVRRCLRPRRLATPLPPHMRMHTACGAVRTYSAGALPLTGMHARLCMCKPRPWTWLPAGRPGDDRTRRPSRKRTRPCAVRTAPPCNSPFRACRATRYGRVVLAFASVLCKARTTPRDAQSVQIIVPGCCLQRPRQCCRELAA